MIFRAVLMRQQNLHKVNIEARTYEDFKTELVGDKGHQALYNDYIRKEADVVAIVLDGKIGGITREEFEMAFSCFKKRKRPSIFVFSRETSDEQNPDIKELKDLLNQHNQYYIEYSDKAKLSVLFEKEINAYIVGRSRSSNVWKWLLLMAFFLIAGIATFLFFTPVNDIQEHVVYDEQAVEDELITVKGTSTENQLAKYKNIGYDSDCLIDGKRTTCWAVNIDKTNLDQEDLYGPILTLNCKKLTKFKIWNGYCKSGRLLKANSYPSKIRIINKQSKEIIFEGDLTTDLQKCEISPDAKGNDDISEIQIIIPKKAYVEGSIYRDLCISEIEFYGYK